MGAVTEKWTISHVSDFIAEVSPEALKCHCWHDFLQTHLRIMEKSYNFLLGTKFKLQLIRNYTIHSSILYSVLMLCSSCYPFSPFGENLFLLWGPVKMPKPRRLPWWCQIHLMPFFAFLVFVHITNYDICHNLLWLVLHMYIRKHICKLLKFY